MMSDCFICGVELEDGDDVRTAKRWGLDCVIVVHMGCLARANSGVVKFLISKEPQEDLTNYELRQLNKNGN